EHFDADEVGPLRMLFAARGYLVFEPNYRGSDTLGNAHMHAIFRDPGEGPNRDVISGIRMLEKQGVVDSSRIAAVGHSYGGYMTAWLISHQHFWRSAAARGMRRVRLCTAPDRRSPMPGRSSRRRSSCPGRTTRRCRSPNRSRCITL